MNRRLLPTLTLLLLLAACGGGTDTATHVEAVETVSPNVIGVTPLLALEAPRQVDLETFEAIKARRAALHDRQRLFLFLPLLGVLVWRARRGPLFGR